MSANKQAVARLNKEVRAKPPPSRHRAPHTFVLGQTYYECKTLFKKSVIISRVCFIAAQELFEGPTAARSDRARG